MVNAGLILDSHMVRAVIIHFQSDSLSDSQSDKDAYNLSGIATVECYTLNGIP